MRTRPYRNSRIISVLQEVYFTGTSSFARRHEVLFPTYYNGEGITTRQVPIPMVALVATAVSDNCYRRSSANLKHKLYAALYEWRSGTFKLVEFTTNTFLDVYQGHFNTFRYILEKRPTAFHAMMGDLYLQAR
jgi:Domain of unknown function (DUF6532)